MAPPKAPDSTRRSDRSRRAIYDAALALVGETGYAKTTIEGIAARAGVGKQTIYRWWPSKAAVLMEAFLDLAARQSAEAAGGEAAGAGATDAAGTGIPDTGDLAADLKLVLRATVDELNDPAAAAPTRALTAEGIVDPALGAQFVERLLDPQIQLYVTRLRAAQDAGEVRADIDPRTALELLIAPLTHRWLLRTLPLTHAYADEIVDYALRGLSPRP
ncbi:MULTISPECIES: TetR/AcrR family transcriptional regulator [unclassified Streptomyces]|uniref:TetR/AcrR family transcriptional regulator n=1 Tax=unclassified Streptomyces TaxID=2593676 RepID=UPI0001C18A13|nr:MULTISPECIES: TetR/AcrR family transcriptional regulator [unclassified Streptomyces]AEN09619.1 transcriptional regulator, TetR family [Streptomyces sp. SirexAA-E]MYR70138.1 TetR family transcriptional regulator [Streptomyces sp. SID4939]MYS04449.1 TetR family transcriptional regulator [Streptomyces sp. SID4940]MYT64521.1 TetR family transcriptional regulator [Streptomyces sp. SID8357]MYT87334.1 TetR family transcriptional regulator [Streptomyces sp. SID8360]